MTNPNQNLTYDRDELCAHIGSLGFLWVSGSCQKSFFIHPDSPLRGNHWEISVEYMPDDVTLIIQYSVDLPDAILYPLIGFCALRGINTEEIYFENEVTK